MITKKLSLFALLACITISCFSQQLAFPGAEGFGRFATGGRTGSVYHVTNLNDSGAGSFRDAVSQPNRVVVFDVGGVIKITKVLVVSANIYIAGQTAPGEGITIYGNRISFSGAQNTICRYLRIRIGKSGDDADGLGIANGANMIFDHVSVLWGRDENFSINSDGKGTNPDNITIQNCIIGQGLIPHSAGGLIQPSGKITIYRTLYIDNDTRNAKLKGTHQYVNNIVYNWKSAAYIMGGDSEGTSYANAVGNYFITGPSGGTTAFSGANSRYNIYAEDNWVDKNKNGVLDGYLIPQNEYSGGPTFQSKPYDYPVLPTIPATQLYDNLSKSVGASLPYRDNADWYLIKELGSLGTKGAFIGDEKDLPFGAPNTWTVWGGTKPTDSDNDGMPDAWETANGLNPNDASDAMKIASNGYTNIENYINSITEANSQPFLKAPMCLSVKEKTQNELTIEWLGYTTQEDGYIIEEKIGGIFQEVKRVGKSINEYTFENLEPESTHIYRVKAYNARTETAYSNELTAKTKPVPVSVEDPATFVPDATWTGATSGNWDFTSNNWNTGAFAAGKSVLFDETGANKTISLTENMNRGSMFVKGDNDYTFSGTGVIIGTGSVNKTGNGKLTLPNNNTYTGATVIWDGTMEIAQLADGGQPSSIGASQNYDFNWVWNGGTIRYTGGSVSTDRNVALANATEFEVANSSSKVTFNGVIDGEGDFIKTGAGSIYSLYGQHTYTGNTIVRDGTYELKGSGAEVGLKGKLILEGGRFKTSGGENGKDSDHSFDVEVNGGDKVSYFEPTRNSNVKGKFSGYGDLILDIPYLREAFKGDWSEYYGTLTLRKIGTLNATVWFLINNENNSAGVPNARVVANDNVQIMGGKNESTYYFGGLSGTAGSYLQCAYIKQNGGSMTWVIGSLGTDEEFKGKINNDNNSSSYTGTTNIVKEGPGYWRLTNNNVYKGTTIINRGNLIINGSHTGTGAITVNESGTLSGKGSVAGAVTVNDGGSVAPGDYGIGTFTIKAATNLKAGSRLNISINQTAKTADKLAVTGALTLGGVLDIDLMDGAFVPGDAFTILSATSYSGAFSQIFPETPGEGLVWDTSALYTSGILKVVAGTGINTTTLDNIRIIPTKGGILIEGLTEVTPVEIYNLSGLKVFNTATNGSCNPSVASGFYVVRTGTKTTKVVVP